MALAETIRISGYPTDERGLVAVQVARRVVADATEFRRGAGQYLAGNWVWESERLWACLMSLDDADEFSSEASRLVWFFHPRASQNLEPIERYGEEILPWLLSLVRGRVLCNVPFCVLPLLLRFPARIVFDVLGRVDALALDQGRFPGPFAPEGPGDVEPSRLLVSRAAVAEALLTFARGNPADAFPLLYESLERNGDVRARWVLESALLVEPTRVVRSIAQGGDERHIRRVLTDAGLPVRIAAERIVASLDAGCIARDPWPVFRAAHPDRAYHALRMLVFVEKQGESWFVLFECLEGSSAGALGLKRYLQGPVSQRLLNRQGEVELFLDGDWDARGEATLVGPRGECRVTRSQLVALEVWRSTATCTKHMLYTVLVRAYLEAWSNAFWPSFRELGRDLRRDGIEFDSYDLLLESREFEHVTGPAEDETETEGDASWRRLPSETRTFRSLARAIAERNPTLFHGGTSNLDWRLHLDAADPARQLD